MTDSASAAGDGPTRTEVIEAYRWILGREPDSEAAIESCLALPGAEALRLRLLRSAEFRRGSAANVPPGLPADAPPPAIETAATPAQVEALLLRQRRLWHRLGEAAPHFSVLPEPRFLPDRIAQTRQAFHAGGRAERDLLEGVLARTGLDAGRLPRLVEFGCGVGRATLHLAALCPEVTGVDISRPHLDLAREAALARGLDHIRWLRARPDLPMPVEGCDLWFSRRVLQHNPPPLIRHLLALAFAGLAPGGAAVFQLMTWGLDYRFGTADHLAAPEPLEPELHALPQGEVFALAAASGLEVLEVQEDPVPGMDRRLWVSHLFVLRRPVAARSP